MAWTKQGLDAEGRALLVFWAGAVGMVAGLLFGAFSPASGLKAVVWTASLATVLGCGFAVFANLLLVLWERD